MADETVNLNVNVGGSATADMQKLTAALDAAAKAEAAYAKSVKEAADSKQESQAFAKDVDRELRSRKSRRQEINDAATEHLESKKRNDEIAAEVARRSKTAGGTFKSAAEGARTLTSGGGAIGLIGKAGPYGAAIAAGAQALDAAATKSADALNIMNSTLHTTAQKEEMLKQEFIPLYASFKKLGEALDGTTARMQKAQLNAEKSIMLNNAVASEIAKYRSFVHGSYQPAEALKNAAAGRPGLEGSYRRFDRATSIGEQAHADYQPVQAAINAARRADLEERAAGEFRNKQQGISHDADLQKRKALLAANQSFSKLKGLRAAGAPKADIAEAAFDAQKKSEAFKNFDAQAQAEKERLVQANVKAAEATGAAERANLEIMKAELDVLKQKEQRMTGYAQKLGSMSQADFEMAKANLEMVQGHLKGGGSLGDLPPELIDSAAQIGGGYIGKEREKFGEKRAGEVSKQFAGMDDANMDLFRQNTLKEIRQKVDDVELKVMVAFDLNAEKTAARIVEMVGPFLNKFTTDFEVRIKKMSDAFDINKILQTRNDG